MTRIDEELSARFSHWEQRGRGWQVYPTPVSPEPLFVPFPGYYLQGAPLVDDGRRPTAISSLLNRLWTPPANAQEPPDEDEPQPVSLERKAVVELPLVLPMSFEPKQDEFAGFISSLALSAEPLAFELIGSPSRVMAQLAVGAVDEAHVRRQLNAFFPEISCAAVPVRELDDAWQSSAGPSMAVDFALGAECVLPLATLRHDLAVPLVAVLGDLRANEMAVYQVLFQAARHPWAENLLRAVTGPDEKPFFVNAPELAQAAKAKIAEPLFGVVARVMACAPEFERVVEILRGIAGAFRAFRNPVGNELIPLHNREYPAELHIDDVLLRQTHRGGMLLNQDELIGFIGFPTNAVRSAKLVRQTRKTKQAPALALSSTGLALGINEHAGISNVVRLGAEQRIRHTHIVGASGTGKSTLLFNLIKQDITNHAGVGILDPHGDLIERILGIIPQDRVQDVVLVTR